MAHLLIDGYNLLAVSDFQNRDQLLDGLLSYRKEKLHAITIVFDGTHGGTGRGDRYFHGGIEVLFTPLTVSADDRIEELLESLHGEIIVVSSDRRLQSAALRADATYVLSQEFASRLRRASRGDGRPTEATPPWMEGRTEEPSPQPQRKRKLSKSDRLRKKKLEKL